MDRTKARKVAARLETSELDKQVPDRNRLFLVKAGGVLRGGLNHRKWWQTGLEVANADSDPDTSTGG